MRRMTVSISIDRSTSARWAAVVPAAASTRSREPPSAATSWRRRAGASARTSPDMARIRPPDPVPGQMESTKRGRTEPLKPRGYSCDREPLPSIEPTPQQLQQLSAAADDGTPIVMLNLLRYRARAVYPPDA